MDRRRFLQSSLAGSALALPATRLLAAPAIVGSDAVRPTLPSGIQIGDVTANRALIWARSDRTARMILEWDTSERFANPRRMVGPWATEATDFTSRVDLSGLPAGQQHFVRVSYQDAGTGRTLSEPVVGRFFTPGIVARPVRFVWSGDTAGQGYGINPEWGGMRIYETMRQQNPDFFVHSGDNIYADGPMETERKVEEGRIWRNLVTEEVSKVAETLNEFRGRYRYNMMDANVRRFASEVPQIWQWDDHEVTNNWSDSKDLSGDKRYQEKNVGVLQARATRAFLEYAPLRPADASEPERIYRQFSHGPLLDVFVVDMRSYRGANSANLQTSRDHDSDFMGETQLKWLLDGLKRSKATWKAIMADMPIGLHVPDGKLADGTARWEAIANGEDGSPKGREQEIAWLLRELKKQRIHNVVWFTADVHYTAAHHYHPNRAQIGDFDPFWEFVSGPLNAGSFGPNAIDRTFGIEVVFQQAPKEPNTSPLAGLQFFGQVDIDPKSKAMTVSLKDLNNAVLFSKQLQPA